jgi:hypothetical protein
VLNAKAFKQGYYPSYVNSLPVELRNPACSGPLAWWKLDETSGNVAKNSAGSGNAVVHGATWIRGWAHGLEFNGKDASVALDSARLVSISNTFTVSC